MSDFIFSTFWGDSASYVANINHILPESITTLIAVLLRDYVSDVTIFNIQIILGFIITFVLSYYVGNKIFKNKFAAIFLALILTFAPIRIRYSMEWAVLTFWGYHILLFYSVFDFIKTKNRISLLLAGITYCLSFTEQPYLGVILTLVIGISTLLFSAISKNKEYYIRTFVLFIILAVFGIPGMYNVHKERYINELYPSIRFSTGSRIEADRWAYSARPWNYLIPDINNPVLGDFAVKANYFMWNQKPYYLTEPFFPKEHTLYLGITLLALSATTIYLTYVKRREFFQNYKEINLFFLIIAVTAFVFSMPPYIAIKGIHFYFPGQLLYEFLPQFRAYARFGAIVFVGISVLSTTTILYLLNKKSKILLGTIFTLLLIEFATPYFSNTISSEPTAPYKWLSAQQGDFSYMEIPRRIDYTDVLYASTHDKKIINAYLMTPENIAEIERAITQDLGNSYVLICDRFVDEFNGKYIFYHEKELRKQQATQKFMETNQVTPELKIALEESWGEPIWGNHVPKSDEDIQKDIDRKNLLQKLKNDPRLNLVQEFERGSSGEVSNANDLDKVTVFEISPNYCIN